RWSFAGDAVVAPSVGGVIPVSFRPSLQLCCDDELYAGKTLTLVAIGPPGLSLDLQYWNGTSWARVSVCTVASNGTCNFPVRLSPVGAYKSRVVRAATDSFLASPSPPMTVTVISA